MASFLSRVWPFQQKGMSTLDIFREIYGGRSSASGINVDWKTALDVATVLACVRALANGAAQVPFRLYQEIGDRKELAKDHPVYRLIYRKPNTWQTSFEFRETIMFHLVLTGNAYVWKGRVGRERQLRVLEPIEPHRVRVERDPDGEITYRVTADDGAFRIYGSSDIWHIRGASWNSWKGLEAVKLARDAIGLSIATERAHAEMHKNGAKVSGVYSVEEKLSKEKLMFLSQWLDMHSAGGDRAHKDMILDGGAKFMKSAMTGVDAQHIETRKHQVEEICRAFGVQPIMVYQSDKASTYASAEQMFIAHVVYTLGPWLERIEQSADNNLLTDEEIDQGYYTKFTPNALMRGASKDRAEFYEKGLGSPGATGYLLRNEVRKWEELNPIEGWDEQDRERHAMAAQQESEGDADE